MWAGDRELTPSKDIVMLRGSRDGIAVIIDEHATLERAVHELRTKLGEAGDFFRGGAFRLYWGERTMTEDELETISSIVEEFGIELREPADQKIPEEAERNEGAVVRKRLHDDPLPIAEPRDDEQTLMIRRTLRSGQRVEYDGNVVVMGDVNAGAVVVCSGDIVVLGSLRGLAHAGAGGNEQAIVMAFRLEPTQLRIARFISRAPDEEGPHPSGPEIARVKGDVIQIEAYVP